MSRNENIELRQRVVAVTWLVGVVVALGLVMFGGRGGPPGVGYGFAPAKDSAPVFDPEPEARLGPHDVEDTLLAEHVREAVDEAREFATLSLAHP